MDWKKLVSVFAASLLVLAGSGQLGAQTTPPPPLPMEPVTFPDYAQRTLSNGAQLIVVQNDEQPVVTVNLRVKSGSAHDPEGLEGLAGATADLLNKGTETRDSREIAEAIDFMGASFSADAGDDWTSVTLTTLTDFLADGLEIMSDVIKNATFPQEELETERKRVLSALRVELSQPESIAQRRFIKAIYGKHPYSSQPTEASVQAIGREEIQAFHSAHYKPGNSLFVVAGDITPDEAAEALERHFGDWSSGPAPTLSMASPPNRMGRDVLFYHKPGSVQAVVRVGHLMPEATHPDWVTLDVALRILGGGSQGWLFQVLRDEKGYTYGAYASGQKRNDLGYLQATAEVRNEVTDSALAELFDLMDRIREEPAPQEDLSLAVNAITGSFPRQIETPQQVAGQVATTRLRGLPNDYLETYRDRVAAVTAEDVQRVAQQHIHPERMVVVVVGDAAQIYDKVEPFGDVKLFDVEGNPITLADLEVKASEVAFDPSIIQPATLVYALNFQGNPIGEAVTEVVRETLDGREVIRSHQTVSGTGFSSRETLLFDASTFEGISVEAGQTMGPQEMLVDLRSENGMIKGRIVTPDGNEHPVDAEVPKGTLLPGMDSYAIWLADFANQEEVKVPAFNASGGTPYTLSIKRVGETTVTVSAGEFQVYELQVSGGDAPVTLYVRKDAPHYMIKQEFANQPVTLELKEIR